jgi:hypothetical protein
VTGRVFGGEVSHGPLGYAAWPGVCARVWPSGRRKSEGWWAKLADECRQGECGLAERANLSANQRGVADPGALRGLKPSGIKGTNQDSSANCEPGFIRRVVRDPEAKLSARSRGQEQAQAKDRVFGDYLGTVPVHLRRSAPGLRVSGGFVTQRRQLLIAAVRPVAFASKARTRCAVSER